MINDLSVFDCFQKKEKKTGEETFFFAFKERHDNLVVNVKIVKRTRKLQNKTEFESKYIKKKKKISTL